MQKIDSYKFTGSEYEPYFKYWKLFYPEYSKGYRFQNINGHSVDIDKKLERFEFSINGNHAQKVYDLVGETDAGVFLVALSIFGMLLNKYSDEERVIIDTPLYGFNEGEKPYTPTVPLLLNINPQNPLKHYLSHCQKVVKECYKYQNFPLHLLHKSFDVDEIYSTNVLIRYKGLHRNLEDESGYDLIVDIEKKGGRLYFVIRYADSTFYPDFIEALQGHILQILNQLCDVTTPLKDIKLLSEREEEHVIRTFNDLKRDYPKDKTLQELFEEQVEVSPDATALVSDGKHLTYRELNTMANRLANHLRDELEVKPNDLIGLMVDRSERMVIAMLAIMKAGAAYVPIDGEYPKERKEYMLNDAKIRLLLTDSAYMFNQDYYSGSLFVLDLELSEIKKNDTPPLLVNTSSDLAYVIYTSGSTGQPKGVMVEHRNVMNMTLDQIRQFEIVPSDRILQFASLSFDASVSEIFMTLGSGASLFIVAKELINETSSFVQFMRENEVSVITLPPSYLSLIPNEALSFLRVLITAGEAAKPGDAQMASQFCNYFNAYGPTECAVCTSIHRVEPNRVHGSSIPIGKPIANVEVYILDTNLEPVPVGVAGEIFVSGPGVSRGYLNRPEMTRDKFMPNPFLPGSRMYRTGDRGRWLQDGIVDYLGRKDFQVKINGYRIELGEIESRLLQHPEVQDAVAIIKTGADKQHYLAAYYVSSAPLDIDMLNEHVRSSLPAYMVPSHIIHMDRFALTTSGKVDRSGLPDPEATREGLKAQYVAPEIYPEGELTKIWEAILNKSGIGVRDNFFYLGGDSIRAIRMVSLINEELRIELEVKDIFNLQDIRSLARYINEELDSEQRKTDRIRATEEVEAIKNDILNNEKLREKLPQYWEDFYPMSHIQTGMLYHTLLDPDSGIYHDQMFHQLKDDQFDSVTFRQTLEHLVSKHQILRTSFDLTTYGQPLQIVHQFRSDSLDLEFIDLKGLEREEQKGWLKKYLAEDLRQPIDMNRPGLWKMRVFELAPDDYGILFVCHHSIIDGWSDASLFTELSNIYYPLRENHPYQVELLKASYKDFIIDQTLIRNSQPVKDFWKSELERYTRTNLPFHKKGYEVASRKNSTFSFSLPQHLNQALNKFAEQHNVTVKHICLAAFVYLLKATTNSDDVTLGLVSNARPDVPDGDKILGCFLNTIPFCVNIPAGITGKDFASVVHRKSQQVKAYDKLALQEILRLIGEQTSDQNPLFDIMFNYVDFHITENQHENIQLQEPIVTGNGSNNTSFGFSIKRIANTHQVSIVCLESLYSVEELKQIGTYYTTIVDQVVNHSVSPLSVTNILSPKERNQQVHAFNSSAIRCSEGKTLSTLFEERAQIAGHHTALSFHEERYSYQEINEKANQLAYYLRESLHVKSDDLIAVLQDRSAATIISILGILKSGAAYLPLDVTHPAERILHILEETQAKALLLDDVGSWQNENELDIPKIYVRAEAQEISKQPKNNPVSINEADNLAYVIYTSGSTGLPKGVMIEHRSVVNTVLDHIDRFSIKGNDRVMQFFNITFDASVFEIFMSLCGGATLVLSDKKTLENIDSYVDYIRAQQVNVIALPPAYLDLISSEKLRFLRLIITGGESPTINTALSCASFAQYFSAYGPSEGAICATTYEVKLNDKHTNVPIGSPIANTNVYVMSEALELLPIGVEGEICISGIGLSRGYVKDEQLTNDKFVRHPSTGDMLYKTGDIGKWTNDGNLIFVRRKDDQVKIRGNRIELNEIRFTLQRYNKVNEAICLVKENGEQEKQLVAYFTTDKEVDISDLRTHLSNYLPQYMIPAFLIPLPSFPLTSNGKIDQRALPDITDESLTRGNKYVAASTDLEHKLIKIWEPLLERKNLGVKDDFFMSGGHSLKAMQAVTTVYKEIHVRIELRDLFVNPTVKKLAKLIENAAKEYQPIPLAPVLDHYPVSHAQKRLWLLDQFAESRTAYNIPGAYVFRGALDKDAFQNAFQTIIDQHESLRTVFVTINGEPRQKILRPGECPFHLEVVKLEGDRLAKEQRAVRLAEEQKQATFDLEKGPLLRAKLLQLEADYHMFLLTMHHIVSDGRSMSIMISEIITCYNAFKAGKTPDLSPPKIQYKDYTIWQNNQLSGERLKDYQAYWLKQFEGEIPLINLPTDRPRPPVKTYTGDSASIALNAELITRTRQLANRTGATLYMTLVAVVKALLYKYTGQEDIVVGSPIVSREHPDLEEQIGFYVNTLSIRSQFKGSESFELLLSGIKENMLKAFEFQAYPFDKLVEDLKVERLADRSPLFDVVVAFQNSASDQGDVPEMNGVVANKFGVGITVSKVDLTFNFVESGDEVIVHLIYNNDLFKKDRMSRLLTHFQTILSSCLEDINVSLDRLTYLPDEELNNVLNTFNGTATNVPLPHRIDTLFESRVSTNPDNIALAYAGQQWTYREINEKANQLAWHIRETYDVQPDDVIAVMVNRSERMIVAILAILKSGGAFLPVDPEYPASRIGYMLENAGVRALITDADLMFNVMDCYTGELLALDIQLPTLTTSKKNLPLRGGPSDLAYVTYTSGSTGQPKGVMIEHASSVNMSLDQIDKFDILEEDNVLQFASLSFDASVSEIFMALYKGATLTMIDKPLINEPPTFIKYIKDNGVTVVTFPPAYLNVLPLEELTFLRVVITAGEEPNGQKAIHLSKMSNYYNAYGPTECAVCVSVFKVSADQDPHEKIPIGGPIANTRVYILDKFLHPVGIGIEGELCVAGKGLARGYLHRPDLTGEKFVPFPHQNGERVYKTGDWGRWRPDGTIELIGRRDAQVKVRGYRIELDEIKNTILLNEDVEDCVAIALDTDHGKELVSYVKRKKRIELWPSVAEYFVYDDVLYGTMAGDELRNEKYRRALQKKIKGKTVLEVGPGGDAILSRICIEEGAERVYAIEILEEAYLKAKKTIEELNLQSKIILIHGDATTIELPEKVDYCVSEIVGSIGGSEGSAKIINSIRDKLKDPACMIPSRSLTQIAAVTLPEDEFQPSFEELGAYYVDRVFEQVGRKFDLRVCLHSFPKKNIISTADVFEDLNYTCHNPLESEHSIRLEITGDSVIHGFAVWLTLYCDDHEVVDSLEDKHIWLPVYLPIFSEGQSAKNGDRIEATVTRTLSANKLNPDFTVEGVFCSKGQKDIAFKHVSPNATEEYRNSTFYQRIFENDEVKIAQKLDVNDLKDTLKGKLPEYMIPTSIVEVEEFATTLNGKIDYKELTSSQPEEKSQPYAAPANEIQQVMVDIWQRTLGRSNIGIADNFFELGGDSIKAIQISSRMHNCGYKVEVKDIFQHASIAEIATVVRSVDRIADQGVVTGDTPFTPIQREFYAWRLNQLHHFNQSMMLFDSNGFDEKMVTAVFSKLQEHHDALRTVFPDDQGTVCQQVQSLELPLAFEVLDLRDDKDKPGALTQEANRIQRSIDLRRGPLMKIALFRLTDGDRLLIVTHHLVVDGVSWRILLEDINTLFKQYKKKEPFELPLKTDSYKVWAERLSVYADSKAFQKEIDYWSKVCSQEVITVEHDYPVEEALLKDIGSQAFALNPKETDQLLLKSNTRFNTEINHILLAALGLALQRAFDIQRLAVSLEGHGREPILKDVDISRTVGWFTSFYPVNINFSRVDQLDRHIKEVKECLRQVPNNGIGYGILKLLTSSEVKEGVDLDFHPQISFNYLGQFDSDTSNDFIQMAKEPMGSTLSPDNQKLFDFDISGIVSGGQLLMTIRYSRTQYKPATVQKLARAYREALQELISFCTQDAPVEPTPSDFTFKGLRIDQVEQLTRDYQIDDICSLAPMQEGILFHRLYDPASTAYFNQVSYRLHGDLKPSLVQKSFNEMFKRHDVLRTAFLHESLDQPIQIILKYREVDFHYQDIQAWDSKEQSQYIQSYKRADKGQLFNLGKDTLMRVAIFQLGNLEYELVWSYHHIIMDGWCTGIFTTEFFELYNSLEQNRPHALFPVVQYKKYIEWLTSQDINASKGFWTEYLDGYSVAESIVNVVSSRKSKSAKELKQLVFTLDKDKTKSLQEIALNHRVTPNTLFQTLWGILLSKYVGTTDVVFGAVVSGRPTAVEGIESMIGLFLNTIPVRIAYEIDSTFEELITQVQREAVESEPFQYYPLVEIQGNTSLNTPLFDHILTFENYPLADEIEGVVSNSEGDPRQAAFGVSDVSAFEETNYDLNLVIVNGSQLRVKFDYNPHVLEEEVIMAMGHHLSNIIDQALDNQEVAIKDISLRTKEEIRHIYAGSTLVKADYPNGTLHALFERIAMSHPDKIALKYQGATLSYGELNKKANQMAHYLRKHYDIMPDDKVAILAERGFDQVIAMLGAMKSGGAYVPIATDFPKNRIEFIVSDTQAKVLLVGDGLDGNFLAEMNCLAISDSCIYERGSTENPPHVNSTNDLAYIIYTSGSTGEPKGVMIPHRGIVNRINWMWKHFGFTTEDIILQKTSYVFDVSVWEFYMTLCYGAELVLCDREVVYDPILIAECIEEHKVTTLHFVPSVLNRFIDEVDHRLLAKLQSLRRVIASGEALFPEIVHAYYQKLETPLYNLYGPTEASVDVTSFTTHPNDEIVPIGKPISNIGVYIVNQQLDIQPKGVSGEILIAGIGLARGYLNKESLTAEKFIENPYKEGELLYKTGDIGRLLSDDNLEYIGRNDTQIKLRGHRIELGEVENVLISYPTIRKAAVVERDDQNGEKFLTAFYESDEAHESDLLRDHLRSKLPEYMIPSHFISLVEFPRTISGKIDREALKKVDANRYSKRKIVLPSSELETQLLEIWHRALPDVSAISVEANFFEIGGHSLKAMKIASDIAKKLCVRVEIKLIFEHPTVRELARAVSQLPTLEQHKIPSAQQQTLYPVAHGQKGIFLKYKYGNPKKAFFVMQIVEFDIIDKQVLEQAVSTIIKRHETLRTTFLVLDNEVKQQIHDPEVSTTYVEHIEVAGGNNIRHAINERAEHPFDLENGPLYSFKCFKLPNGTFKLLICMDHIISDGWSSEIIKNEVILLYNALKEGEKSALPPLEVQYKDYACWQDQVIKEKEQPHREYWHALLSEPAPISKNKEISESDNYVETIKREAEECYEGIISEEIEPFYGNVFSLKPLKGASYRTFIREDLLVQLNQVQQTIGVSLFSIIAASAHILLFKYTGCADSIIGTPVTLREHKDLQDLAGWFLNTILLRNKIDKNATLQRFVKRVQEHCTEGLEHRSYPFEQLLYELNKPLRSVSRVFVHLLNFETTKKRRIADFRPSHADEGTPTFDLNFTFREFENGIELICDYNKEVYSARSVEEMTQQFLHLIDSFAQHPDQKIGNLLVLEDEPGHHPNGTGREESNRCHSRRNEPVADQ